MAYKPPHKSTDKIPVPQVARWLVPVKRFLHIEATSGVVLMLCTLIALLIANSPWDGAFEKFWHTHVAFELGKLKIDGHLGHLIVNDVLMTIFFFVVGLEVKREVVAGELRDPRKALLPIVGALGGVVTPALIYFLMQYGQEGQRGWAIPMATDIAFVVGILALLGNRIPFGLKIFLLTLAIVDDILAVLVIATVFTETIAWGYLMMALVGFALCWLLNRIGVREVPIYVIVGIAIWVGFYKAGIHPTIAGVVLGLMTPATAWIRRKTFLEVMGDFWDSIRQDREADEAQNDTNHPSNERHVPINLEQLRFLARESHSPLHRLEMGLHPWVAYAIMPIFALANAGVELDPEALTSGVSIAVATGLAMGKPLGIFLFCFLAVRLGWTRLPNGVTWPIFLGGACLGGIGFTMALFLNALSFPVEDYPVLEGAGKIGTLAGSAISAVLGTVILLSFTKSSSSQDNH
ncbi:MAG: Na+/H+ antiporter NhaA [Planctomycetaceae bacterium]|nr:Na+/H+ antiporter NhaA [Planctomycetaceae bacterium]